MKNLNNTAFSLLEILMAAIIFIITVAGVFATLNATRTPVATKEQELQVATFEKQALEDLRSQVNTKYQMVGSSYFYTCHNVYNSTLPIYCSGVGCWFYECSGFDLSLGVHTVPLFYLPQDLQNSITGGSLPSAVVAANSNSVCSTPAYPGWSSPPPPPVVFCLTYTVSCADTGTVPGSWPYTCTTADIAHRVDISM